jgi:hypothetical protein
MNKGGARAVSEKEMKEEICGPQITEEGERMAVADIESGPHVSDRLELKAL